MKKVRLQGSVEQYHGRIAASNASLDWKAPRLIAKCAELARPKYNSQNDASEYLDEPEVLEAKMELVANLIIQSENMVVYTGAGISTSAGIGDYASKAAHSRVTKPNPSLNRLKAQPTRSHCILADMEKVGYVKHWVQQNHDGLAQKAGYPKEKLNEIHGSWFDRKNPVVLMDDGLRSDLFDLLCEWEQRTDLCLAMGSSLCGMNSDRIVTTCSTKWIEQGIGLGSVIINLQTTPLDDRCAVRIFASIDDAMEILARKLKLRLKLTKKKMKEINK